MPDRCATASTVRATTDWPRWRLCGSVVTAECNDAHPEEARIYVAADDRAAARYSEQGPPLTRTAILAFALFAASRICTRPNRVRDEHTVPWGDQEQQQAEVCRRIASWSRRKKTWSRSRPVARKQQKKHGKLGTRHTHTAWEPRFGRRNHETTHFVAIGRRWCGSGRRRRGQTGNVSEPVEKSRNVSHSTDCDGAAADCRQKPQHGLNPTFSKMQSLRQSRHRGRRSLSLPQSPSSRPRLTVAWCQSVAMSPSQAKLAPSLCDCDVTRAFGG